MLSERKRQLDAVQGNLSEVFYQNVSASMFPISGGDAAAFITHVNNFDKNNTNL